MLFAQGCFWHGHNCHLFKWPKSQEEFWRTKIRQNQARDRIAIEQLRKAGWRIGQIWECALKGRTRLAGSNVLDRCEKWLLSAETCLVVEGVSS